MKDLTTELAHRLAVSSVALAATAEFFGKQGLVKAGLHLMDIVEANTKLLDELKEPKKD